LCLPAVTEVGIVGIEFWTSNAIWEGKTHLNSYYLSVFIKGDIDHQDNRLV